MAATDAAPRSAKVDKRKRYTEFVATKPVGAGYQSPEDALRAWREGRMLSESAYRLIARSVKSGLPACLKVVQQERLPDGRDVKVVILTIDARVTPIPEHIHV
jgi:hypothetical protein